MAADHRRRRSSASDVVGLGPLDRFRTKKRKKVGSVNSNLNSKSHICLEWDYHEDKVIARRDQISISTRAMLPFRTSPFHARSSLADVVTVPGEIFELTCMNDVLSYEVWQSKLTENERRSLRKFLPPESDHDELVETLLSGENFHFGNSFMQWGAKLCAGDLHPDSVYNEEEKLMGQRSEHYSDIQQYHTSMIAYLQKLKDSWERNRVSEIDGSPVRSKVRGEENTGGTSNSSSVEERKTCSSDNQVSSVMNGVVSKKKRIIQKAKKKESKNHLPISEEAEQEEMISVPNVVVSDGSEYMSYIKISKKQYDIIRNMKDSELTIRSKSLKRVLGSMNALHVQPYEAFEREEDEKMKEHWTRLVKADIPTAYTKWKDEQQQREETTLLLCQEISASPASSDEDDEKSDAMITQHKVEKEILLDQDQDDNNSEPELVNRNGHAARKISSDYASPCQLNTENPESCIEVYEDAASASTYCNPEDQVSSYSDGHGSNNIVSGSNDVMPQTNEYTANGRNVEASLPLVASSSRGDMYFRDTVLPSTMVDQSFYNPCENGYSRVAGRSESSIYQGVGYITEESLCGKNGWPLITTGSSYYYPGGKAYPSGVSVADALQQPALEEDARKRIPQRSSEDASFSTYSNPDRSGLLQSLFSRQEITYPSEQKQIGVEFRPPNNMPSQDSVQAISVDHRRRVLDNLVAQNASNELFLESSGYSMTPVNLPEWVSNSVLMQSLIEPPFPHDMIAQQKWLPDGGSAGHSMVSNADQSLYSMLSQCSQLRSDRPFGSIDSADQMIMPRNNAMMSSAVSRMSNPLPHGTHHPSELLGGSTESGWVNMPQNYTHDSMGRPFMRSWNQ